MAPTLAYWAVRGFAQPIKMMLAHAGAEWEDKEYFLGPPPTFDRSSWFNEKFKLGLEFPNLPYWVDGDLKITQSIAITRHVARQNGLAGTTDAERTRIDVVEQQIVDYRSHAGGLFYQPKAEYEAKKPEYEKNLQDKYQALSNYLGDRKWFAGENLSYADFLVHEFLDQHRLFSPGSFDKFKNLVEFMKRLETLPNVAKYMKSDRYMKWPLNNDQASFGSRLQPCPQ